VTQLRVVALLLAVAVAAASWGLTCAAWRADRVIAGVAPLEPRRFDRFVVVLGTAAAGEDSTAAASTPGGLRQSRSSMPGWRGRALPGEDPRPARRVLLTSLMPEYRGLDDHSPRPGSRAGAPIRVLGPPGTAALANTWWHRSPRAWWRGRARSATTRSAGAPCDRDGRRRAAR
jgi:hypothetical protein